MKHKKSKFVRVLCLLLLSLMLTVAACAEEAAPVVTEDPEIIQTEATVQPEASIEAESSAEEDKSLIEKLRTTVQLPETFLITYAVEHQDGTVEFVSYGRDSEGRYYIAKDGSEALFIPEITYYRQAGVEQQAYTLSHIEIQAQEFMTYADGSLMQYAVGAEYVGAEEICGRTADVYEIVRDVIVFEHTSRFAVDQETGICLYTTDDSSIMGYELDPIKNVTCTQFEIENVVLPGTES